MCANGLAILSETRFLPKLGLAPKPNFGQGNQTANNSPFGTVTEPQQNSSETSARISAFLQSVRMLLRWPLMIINWIFIVIIVVTY